MSTKRTELVGRLNWAAVAVALLMLVPSSAATAAQPAGSVTVWEAGGLTSQTIEGVRVAASTQGGAIHVRQSGSLRLMGVTRDGEDVQRPDPGFGYPMAALAVETDDPLLPAAVGLSGDGVLMSERSAALRGARKGDSVEIEGWDQQIAQFEIVDVVPDAELDWYEIVISADGAGRLAFDRDASMVVSGANGSALASAIRWMVRSPVVRVSVGGASISATDPTLPTVVVKERFGEFAFRPTGRGDAIEIEQTWLDEYIVDAYIDGLGPFRCNRAVMPYLRSVVTDLSRQGLMDEVDYDDFQLAGGCFNARMMRGGDKGYALSRHAWGIAIDINPSTNRYGGTTELSSDVGNTFRRWGFSWGATWTVPDGMHFEWTGAPARLEACDAGVRLLAPSSSSVTWSVEPVDENDCGS